MKSGWGFRWLKVTFHELESELNYWKSNKTHRKLYCVKKLLQLRNETIESLRKLLEGKALFLANP
jgi:hypothetical protein